MSPNKALFLRLENATARVERMVLIAAAMSDAVSLPDDLDDFLDEDVDDIEKTFGRVLPPWLRECLDDAHERGDAFREWATDNDMLGFLVKMATPVMEQDANGATFSWGYYRTQWVYADTLDTAIEAGLAWVEQQRADERKQAGINEA